MQPHNTPLSVQTPRAFAGQLYNTQKLLEFDRGETPAYKAIELLDYLDDLEDRRVREQVAQAGSSNVDSTGGTEVCTHWLTQVWISSGQVLNCWVVNSGQVLNCNRIHSGQIFN
jgi:hypothetical protein